MHYPSLTCHLNQTSIFRSSIIRLTPGLHHNYNSYCWERETQKLSSSLRNLQTGVASYWKEQT